MKRKPRILVIDDDPSFGAFLAHIGSKHGMVIEHGTSLDDFEDFHLEDADALVVDYHLEGQTGFDIGNTLKSRKIRKPVLLVSASQDALRARVWPECVRSLTDNEVFFDRS